MDASDGDDGGIEVRRYKGYSGVGGDRHTTCRHTDIFTDGQAHRPRDRQTDRRTERERGETGKKL